MSTQPQKPTTETITQIIATPENIREIRAKFPKMPDWEIAELLISLSALPDGMRYFRDQAPIADILMSGAQQRAIDVFTAVVASVPK